MQETILGVIGTLVMLLTVAAAFRRPATEGGTRNNTGSTGYGIRFPVAIIAALLVIIV